MTEHKSKLSDDQIEFSLFLAFPGRARRISRGFRYTIIGFVRECMEIPFWFRSVLDELPHFFSFLDNLEHLNYSYPQKESVISNSLLQLSKHADIIKLNAGLKKIYIEQTQEITNGKYYYDSSFPTVASELFELFDRVQDQLINNYNPEWQEEIDDFSESDDES
ncbi:hypothetical protein CLV59_103635 [Chitinophaga dinghuensis]|uniref:Uncharacterized protein n=1 Tax=Chitinophaga dinghuensis TaxID=1539050 RepID=A0A327W6N1_9BACT|nr:hypothetical protein [Chitinophaga dinghuensis]RAJ83664.1 hypothetical protein CLV59_103635 [Chitinophaga dinghuensis]